MKIKTELKDDFNSVTIEVVAESVADVMRLMELKQKLHNFYHGVVKVTQDGDSVILEATIYFSSCPTTYGGTSPNTWFGPYTTVD